MVEGVYFSDQPLPPTTRAVPDVERRPEHAGGLSLLNNRLNTH